MGTTQLQLYNEALTEHLGERRLASLAEEREPRRALDDAWNNGAFIRRVLEKGQWKFALRVSMVDYTGAVTPSFGPRHAFEKPADLVTLTALCTDEYLRSPLLHYVEESGYWFSDHERLYIGYVSDDVSYGADLSKWPESFTRFAAAELAFATVARLKNNRTDKGDLLSLSNKLLVEAKSKDAMSGPTRFMPQGSWVSARGGSSIDRGSRVSLYG